MKKIILALLCLSGALRADEEPVSKIQIVYLAQSQDLNKALDLYKKYKNQVGHHDFEVLSQLAQIILTEGAKSGDNEKQLLSLYGSGIAGISSSLDLLENAISSTSPQIQVATIQILSQMQDDRADDLLTKAMASMDFTIRMEAAYQLALRKHHKAVGYIESLMYRLPPQLRFFFPQFFALIGTKEAMICLRQLMSDKEVQTRIESILNAAKFGRDDLLPIIRASATHFNIPEQEACAAALGYLKDSKSLSKLKTLAKSKNAHVKLAALKALHQLGDASAPEEILAMAKEKDLFAIAVLGDLHNGEEVLVELLKSEDLQIRFNAAVALLQKKDSRCLNHLLEILLRDVRDLCFFPMQSPGRSLAAWKVIPSARHHLEDYPYDLYSVSLAFREHVLKAALELKEKEFLFLADTIFESKQTELVPLLVRLLENLQTPEAVKLLKNKAQKAGAPFIRAYCNLSAYRLKQEGPYETILKDWIVKQKDMEIIRFRAALPFGVRLPDTSFELTPEESARLLIESYEALSTRHEATCIDFLLQALKASNPKNRCVLAGILLKTLE